MCIGDMLGTLSQALNKGASPQFLLVKSLKVSQGRVLSGLIRPFLSTGLSWFLGMCDLLGSQGYVGSSLSFLCTSCLWAFHSSFFGLDFEPALGQLPSSLPVVVFKSRQIKTAFQEGSSRGLPERGDRENFLEMRFWEGSSSLSHVIYPMQRLWDYSFTINGEKVGVWGN